MNKEDVKVGMEVIVKNDGDSLYFSTGAIGTVKSIGVYLCLVKFTSGEFERSSNDTWYVYYKKIEPYNKQWTKEDIRGVIEDYMDEIAFVDNEDNEEDEFILWKDITKDITFRAGMTADKDAGYIDIMHGEEDIGTLSIQGGFDFYYVDYKVETLHHAHFRIFERC